MCTMTGKTFEDNPTVKKCGICVEKFFCCEFLLRSPFQGEQTGVNKFHGKKFYTLSNASATKSSILFSSKWTMEEKEVARSLKYVILFSERLAFGGRSANIYRV